MAPGRSTGVRASLHQPCMRTSVSISTRISTAPRQASTSTVSRSATPKHRWQLLHLALNVRKGPHSLGFLRGLPGSTHRFTHGSHSVGTDPSICGARRSGSGCSIATASTSWAARRWRCRCDAPSPSMRCAGRPHPRSRIASVAGSWFGPLLFIITIRVLTASTVRALHSSASVSPL